MALDSAAFNAPSSALQEDALPLPAILVQFCFHHVLGYLCEKSCRWRHERWRYRWVGKRRLDGRRIRIIGNNKIIKNTNPIMPI